MALTSLLTSGDRFLLYVVAAVGPFILEKAFSSVSDVAGQAGVRTYQWWISLADSVVWDKGRTLFSAA